MNKRKVYDREFKENAIKLSYERSDTSNFARELGITTKQLYSWRSQYKHKGKECFPGKGKTAVSEKSKELVRLKKEYDRLRQEHEILKKDLGIISKSDL